MSERIEVRAFRGTRKKSVYRSHSLAASDLTRIAAAGRESRFRIVPTLSSLPCELGKGAAVDLAAELTELRRGAALLALDDDLTALAELARFCGRARGGAWLRIDGSSR